MKLWAITTGVISGNFIFQFFRSIPDYARAFDISYFQFAVVLAIYIIQVIEKK
jgi:hypothetical protein